MDSGKQSNLGSFTLKTTGKQSNLGSFTLKTTDLNLTNLNRYVWKLFQNKESLG